MGDRGFFVVQRKARTGWFWQLPPEQFKVAMTIIADANWIEGSTFSGGEVVTVRRGELMTSIKSLAGAAGVSERCVRTTIKNLEKAEFLTSKATNRFRILTLHNYCRHQDIAETDRQAERQASDKPATSDRQAGDNDITNKPINQGTKEPRKRTFGSSGEVASVAATVTEAYNRVFSRRLGPRGFEAQVKRLLAKGFTEAEMRGVVWWAGLEWANDPEWRMKIDPSTLLKLQGKRTFPQYLELANEQWRETHDGQDPPWLKQPELKGVS